MKLLILVFNQLRPTELLQIHCRDQHLLFFLSSTNHSNGWTNQQSLLHTWKHRKMVCTVLHYIHVSSGHRHSQKIEFLCVTDELSQANSLNNLQRTWLLAGIIAWKETSSVLTLFKNLNSLIFFSADLRVLQIMKNSSKTWAVAAVEQILI